MVSRESASRKMATIKDIARIVGVSLMTVSRALNEPEKVKPETRDKIEAVARELNYYPNNVARSLARRCTRIVFVYIPKGLSTEPFDYRRLPLSEKN